MFEKIRFSDYLHEAGIEIRRIRYQRLMPEVRLDSEGREIPHVRSRLKLRPRDVFHLLSPYIGKRFFEQVRAIVPLALYMALFQWLVLHTPVRNSFLIAAGLFAALVGLMLFLEGLKLGLMPFSETIGNGLPRKTSLGVVLAIAFILGVGVTFAEPAIGVLQVAGAIVDPARAPYLHALLTMWSFPLVAVVGIGVGIAAVIGTIRFVFNWSLKPIIYLTIVPTLLVTVYAWTRPELRPIIGLAWDCGGVTTGPVTVPLVLALGIGVSSAVSGRSSAFSGFGIVTLASILPVLAVLLLGIYASATLSLPDIAAAAETLRQHQATTIAPIWTTSPIVEIITGLRAIVPLIAFLFIVLRFLVKEKTQDAGVVRYGLILSVIGIVLFNLGLTYGLAQLGSQAGGLIPGAFTQIDNMVDSPLFNPGFGIATAFFFAWVLGFGATIAEPALKALGVTVETLTAGAFKESFLIYAVAIGVAMGIGIGVLKIIFHFELTTILLVAYTIVLILTFFSSEAYVNVAWDSAGVTTGPVTVPLVLVMGLGFGNAVSAVDGFGILAIASVCPIMSVLIFGLVVEFKLRRRMVEETQSPPFDERGVSV